MTPTPTFQLRGDHLLLTITHQEHLRQLEGVPDLPRLITQLTGWRLVPSDTQARAARQAAPQSPDFSSPNPFSLLASDPPTLPAEHAPSPDIASDHRNTPPPQTTTDLPPPLRPPAATEPQPIAVGSLNLNGLTDNNIDDKLSAVLGLMEAHRIGVLAIQETRQTHAVITCALQRVSPSPGVFHYLGVDGRLLDSAPVTDPLAERPAQLSGGHGFIVHPHLVPRVRYRGHLGAAHDYGTCWLTIKARPHLETLHLGCVYLPDSGLPRRRRNGGADLF